MPRTIRLVSARINKNVLALSDDLERRVGELAVMRLIHAFDRTMTTDHKVVSRVRRIGRVEPVLVFVSPH